MEPYKLPLCAAEAEFTEKKSRFIGHITPASSENEALTFLRSIRERRREATHNVYAYRIIGRADSRVDGGVCRHSDDGEPSGTAGMPLLDVFIKQGVYDFCCVATRYFGGVKLGAGGLVRAYARCGALALEASGIGVMSKITLCATTLPYAVYEPLKRLMSLFGAEVISEDFEALVELKFSLLSENLPAFQSRFIELTAGKSIINIEGTRMSAVKI